MPEISCNIMDRQGSEELEKVAAVSLTKKNPHRSFPGIFLGPRKKLGKSHSLLEFSEGCSRHGVREMVLFFGGEMVYEQALIRFRHMYLGQRMLQVSWPVWWSKPQLSLVAWHLEARCRNDSDQQFTVRGPTKQKYKGLIELSISHFSDLTRVSAKLWKPPLQVR